MMKKLYHTSKILLLFVFLTGVGLTAHAQAPKAVFQKVSAAIKSGDATAMSASFNNSLEVTTPGTDKTFSKNQAVFVLKQFFSKHQPVSFTISHQGQSGPTHYATGVYRSKNGNFDTNIFLKKIGDKFLVTQIRFEEE